MNSFSLSSLPSELWLEIGSYFNSVSDVYSLSLSNSKLYNMFFCKKNQNFIIAFFSNSEREAECNPQVQTKIWMPLLKSYFPNFQTKLNVQNYLMVLKRRIKLLMVKKPQELAIFAKTNKTGGDSTSGNLQTMAETITEDLSYEIIEGCEWIYKCPIDFASQNIDRKGFHCKVCKKDVYAIDRFDKLAYHTEMGHCVTFTDYRGIRRGGCIIY